MTKHPSAPILLVFLTILVGCSVPVTSEGENFPDPTSIYQTISAKLTATNPVTPTAVLPATSEIRSTSTLERTATVNLSPSPTNAILSTATVTSSLPCNRASAGKPAIDITIPDGFNVQPGELFSKTWRLVNAGSCPWTRRYALVWFSGELFGSTREQFFSDVVESGQSVDLTVDMVAPQDPGVHQTNWKLRASDGTLFGLGPAGDAPFWARIEVEETSVQPLLITLTLTPTAVVAVNGTVDLALNDSLDFDSGKTGLGTEDDLALLMHGEETVFVMPINGARLSIFGAQSPTEEDCSVSTLSGDGFALQSISENTYICYRTNQGLPGSGRINGIKEQSFSLDFTTWMVP